MIGHCHVRRTAPTCSLRASDGTALLSAALAMKTFRSQAPRNSFDGIGRAFWAWGKGCVRHEASRPAVVETPNTAARWAASWNADCACRNDQRRSASVHQGVTRPVQLKEAVRRTWLRRSLDLRRISNSLAAAVCFRFQWKFRLLALMMSMCESGTYAEPETMPSTFPKSRDFK